MANDKKFVVKNGLTTQNIAFVDDITDANNTINVTMIGGDTLSFSGDTGQLFSITDSQTGTIFAVNDISGVPSIEVDDDGTVRFAETFGNVLVGTATDDGSNKLQVDGSVAISNYGQIIDSSGNWVGPNSGLVGYTGSKGDVGFTGSRGVIGYTGSRGATGFTGSQGIQGIQGLQGYTGSRGNTGNTGATGFTGSKGDQGTQGVIGYTGSQGSQGATGFTGSRGATGNTGATGFTGSRGDDGVQGLIGYTGSKGTQGIQGVTGFTGSRGNTGATGFTGSRGATGFTGSRGATGNTGATGFTGSRGNTGLQGVIGYTGSQGIQGIIGYTGSQGSPDTAAQILAKLITVDGPGSGLNADTLDGINSASFLRSDTSDTMTGDLSFNSGANIHRNTHSSGFLVGSYNSVAANSTRTNPIYTIGSSYQPNDGDLVNMYGIGYTTGSAAYDGINNVLSGWGMYVAADGDARIGLDAQNGIIKCTGAAYVNTNQRVFADNYHPNADKWTTARTLSLSGDVSGSVSWDGSANASISVTIADDSHNHTIANVDGLQTALNGKLSTSGTAANSNLLSSIPITGFQRQIDEITVNLASPAASSGTWTNGDADDWGTPRIGTSVARYNDGTGYLQFNVPADMDTAYLSQLCWSSGGYADIYGVQADGGLVFLRRINTRQTIENANEGSNAGNNNQHDGSTITLAASGLSYFSAIRIQNRSGRLHLTGLGFTSARLHGAEGVGLVHPQQLSVQGSGSGLDADLLDGVQGSSFLRSDAADTATGEITFNSGITVPEYQDINIGGARLNYYFLPGAESLDYYADIHYFRSTAGSNYGWFHPGGITSASDVYAFGNITAQGNVTAYSDERLKSNIKTIDNAVDTVKKLRGVTFEKDGQDSLGVIAQEVQKVLPELVQENDEYLSVAYGNMVGLLIEAIKEQQKQIDELKRNSV